MTEPTIHHSVLRDEAIDALALADGDTVVDATLGGGGYTKALWERIGATGKVFAFDWDQYAVERFEQHVATSLGETVLIHASFAQIAAELAARSVTQVDAIVADLGLSSDQLDDPTRGFSFRSDGPLDMRFDTSQQQTVHDVLQTSTPEDLAQIMRDYGDERYAWRIAQAIIAHKDALQTTGDLSTVIKEAVPAAYRHGKKHPATRTFQALRIYLNREYEHIEKLIVESIGLLRPGGRLAIVTFHSGEDALVKGLFRKEARGCECPEDAPVCVCGKEPRVRLVTRKPITPTAEEVHSNPRARSAQLRVVERL